MDITKTYDFKLAVKRAKIIGLISTLDNGDKLPGYTKWARDARKRKGKL